MSALGSVCCTDNGWNSSALLKPLLEGLEPHAKLVVEDAQGAIAIAHNGFRHDALDLLRHHADIGAIAAVVAEAIVAEAIGEMAEENNVMLEHDVGSPSSATAAAAAAAEAAATAAAEAATTHAAAETAAPHAAAEAAAAQASVTEARASTRRMQVGRSARTDMP